MTPRITEKCLDEFVRGERTLAALEQCLDGLVKLHFWDVDQREVELKGDLPTICFRRSDIDAQLTRFLAKKISTRDLSDWAGVIRLLGCFKVHPEEPEASDVWDVIDEIMSPDAWGAATVEGALELQRRLRPA